MHLFIYISIEVHILYYIHIYVFKCIQLYSDKYESVDALHVFARTQGSLADTLLAVELRPQATPASILQVQI